MEMGYRDNVWESMTILPSVNNIKKAENTKEIIRDFDIS